MKISIVNLSYKKKFSNNLRNLFNHMKSKTRSLLKFLLFIVNYEFKIYKALKTQFLVSRKSKWNCKNFRYSIINIILKINTEDCNDTVATNVDSTKKNS